MFFRRFSIALAALMIFTSATAHALECPAYVEPSIAINPLDVPSKIDDNVSLAQIRSIGERPDAASPGSRQMPVGVTESSLRFDSSFTITTHSRSDETQVCAQISKFTMNFGFNNTIVYVAREIPRHSCGYEEVLEHEAKHVATDRWITDSYMPQLPALLAGALREIGVIYAESAVAAEKRIHEAVDQYLRDLSESISGARERQQEQIDTPEEYRRLSYACNGELGRLVGRIAGY